MWKGFCWFCYLLALLLLYRRSLTVRASSLCQWKSMILFNIAGVNAFMFRGWIILVALYIRFPVPFPSLNWAFALIQEPWSCKVKIRDMSKRSGLVIYDGANELPRRAVYIRDDIKLIFLRTFHSRDLVAIKIECYIGLFPFYRRLTKIYDFLMIEPIT